MIPDDNIDNDPVNKLFGSSEKSHTNDADNINLPYQVLEAGNETDFLEDKIRKMTIHKLESKRKLLQKLDEDTKRNLKIHKELISKTIAGTMKVRRKRHRKRSLQRCMKKFLKDFKDLLHMLYIQKIY